MSKLNASLYSSKDHTWQTPPKLVEALLKFEERDQFYLDPCCTDKNIPAKFHYQHPYMDGLALSWTGLAFINPPYGTILKDWMKKAYLESQKPGCQVWALIPSRTETVYQHDLGITKAAFTVFLKGRLQFWKDGKPFLMLDKKTGKMRPGTAPFPTMLLYYGKDWQEKAEKWIENPPLAGTLMFPGGNI